jgi:hypothetical protein
MTHIVRSKNEEKKKNAYENGKGGRRTYSTDKKENGRFLIFQVNATTKNR